MRTSDLAILNSLLSALPERERALVLAAGEVVSLAAGDIVHQSGETIRDVFFPLDSVCALATCLEDGTEAEVAIIGREGLVGITALLGATRVAWNVTAVRLGGRALRVAVDRLRPTVARSGPVRLVLQRFAQALLVQTSQTAACNRFHTIEQRLGRFLLALDDRVDGDVFEITHDRLAIALGSLRPGVTLAAGRLQEQGLISYTRGRIRIVDRARLATAACECYEAVAGEYGRLLRFSAQLPLEEAAELADETLRELNSRLMLAALREQQARERAEEASDVAAMLFATLSHELRTPLTAILGWADLLKSGNVDDEMLQVAIDTIRRNAEAQKHLLNDMMDLARLRAGKLPLRIEPLTIGDALLDAVQSSRPAADAAGIAISVIASEAVTLSADPVRLQQILNNLLSNALKFTPRGGSIEVAAVAGPHEVRITVRDTGRGITPEFLPFVFDQFRQGLASPRGELGLGLGLSIVRQLAILHGGTVEAQSAGLDRGATFTVVLPRVSVREEDSSS